MTDEGGRVGELLHELEVEDHVVLADVVAVGEGAARVARFFVIHRDPLSHRGTKSQEVVVSAASRVASVERKFLKKICLNDGQGQGFNKFWAKNFWPF